MKYLIGGFIMLLVLYAVGVYLSRKYGTLPVSNSALDTFNKEIDQYGNNKRVAFGGDEQSNGVSTVWDSRSQVYVTRA